MQLVYEATIIYNYCTRLAVYILFLRGRHYMQLFWRLLLHAAIVRSYFNKLLLYALILRVYHCTQLFYEAIPSVHKILWDTTLI